MVNWLVIIVHYWRAVRLTGIEVTKIASMNYPENLRRVFIINGNFCLATVVIMAN